MLTTLLLLLTTPLVAGAGAPPPPAGEEAAVALAKKTLAGSMGAAESGLEVLAAAAAQWPDTGLGCPAEGLVVETRPVRGYRVTLRAEGSVYRVHVGEGRAAVCGRGFKSERVLAPAGTEDLESLPLIAPVGAVQEKLVDDAKADLGKRLSVSHEGIDLVGLDAVVWPDASLGCPTPGMAYPQVTREGYRITLRVGKRRHEYHSGGGAPRLCETPAGP